MYLKVSENPANQEQHFSWCFVVTISVLFFVNCFVLVCLSVCCALSCFVTLFVIPSLITVTGVSVISVRNLTPVKFDG